MVIPKPPISTLVDEFLCYPYNGIDDYGKSLFGEETRISHARIDRSARYTVSSAGKELMYNAVIFCYEGLTQPMLAITPRSKVVFDDEEHIVTAVILNKEPYTENLYSIEIEVV